jgi:hypothetical protein
MPPVLKEFEKMRHRNKALYIGAYDLMKAVTGALREQQVTDFSPLAYFASLGQMFP